MKKELSVYFAEGEHGFGMMGVIGGLGVVALVVAGWLYFSPQDASAPGGEGDIPSASEQEGAGSPSASPEAGQAPSPTQPKATPPPAKTPPPASTPAVSTTGWKVYHSDSYGFEVKYPPISPWEVSENERYTKDAITVTLLNRTAGRQVALTASVQVKPNVTATEEVAYWKSLGLKVTESSATVAGIAVKRLDIVNEALVAKPRSTIYILGRGARLYLIGIYGVDTVKDADSVMFFNEVVKTFTFL